MQVSESFEELRCPGSHARADIGPPSVIACCSDLAPWLWVMAVGTVLFGFGFGALDTTLNAHAARHFGARDVNWMHASYGLGAILGPLLVTALLAAGRSWRQTYGIMALALAAMACVLAVAGRGWQATAPPACWRSSA